MTHAKCFACGAENEVGLGLAFLKDDNSGVAAECIVSDQYQGYRGVVQGGIVATILDSAMTNCLFSQGIEAMTVRLNIRFRKPVLVSVMLYVNARLKGQSGRVFDLESVIRQDGQVKAVATAKFMVKAGADSSAELQPN